MCLSHDILEAIADKIHEVNNFEKHIHDSTNCRECRELWEKLKQDDEVQIEELKQQLILHK